MIGSPWAGNISFINTVMTSTLVQEPMLCLLGVLLKGNGLHANQISWCRAALLTRCRIVLRHWKTKGEISLKEWLGEMAKMSSYERLSYKLMDRQDIYIKIWGPYVSVTRNSDVLHLSQ